MRTLKGIIFFGDADLILNGSLLGIAFTIDGRFSQIGLDILEATQMPSTDTALAHT